MAIAGTILGRVYARRVHNAPFTVAPNAKEAADAKKILDQIKK